MVNPTQVVATDDQTTLMEATGEFMANPIISRTKVPRAVTDDQTARMGTTGAPTVDSTTNRIKTPRASMNHRATTLTAADKVAMANLRTNTGELKVATNDPMTVIEADMVGRTTTATVGPKTHTGATPPVMADRMIVLTEVVRKVMIDLTTTPADRNRDMAALEEVMFLSETKMTSRMTQAVIVRDINPHISRHTSPPRALTPLATPILPVILIPPGEVTVEALRWNQPTTLLPRVTIHMAGRREAVMVAKAIPVEGITRKTIIKSTTTIMTRPMVLGG